MSTCKNAFAFSTAACCLLVRLLVSNPVSAEASANTSACLLDRFCRFSVFAILLFSNATCCYAVKFLFAMSLILEAF